MEKKEITERTSDLEARVLVLEQIVRMLISASPQQTRQLVRSMAQEYSEVLPALAVSEQQLERLQRSIYEVALRVPGE